MALAMIYPEPERGRGKTDDAKKSAETASFQARKVLEMPIRNCSPRSGGATLPIGTLATSRRAGQRVGPLREEQRATGAADALGPAAAIAGELCIDGAVALGAARHMAWHLARCTMKHRAMAVVARLRRVPFPVVHGLARPALGAEVPDGRILVAAPWMPVPKLGAVDRLRAGEGLVAMLALHSVTDTISADSSGLLSVTQAARRHRPLPEAGQIGALKAAKPAA
jgi:hypothetical protein